MYYDINIDLARRPAYTEQLKAIDADHAEHVGQSELVEMEKDVSESLHGRTGGAVTLAVGMARIFTAALPGIKWLIGYWYHFAIMFEALFILTTIDTGTRIARFLLQEFLGKAWKPLGNLDWLPASMLATGLVVLGWGYFIWTGSVDTIWPMFGMANQLLAVIALAIVTTWIINSGRVRYAPATLVPMLFVTTTTATAGYYEITGKFYRMVQSGAVLKGYLNIGLTVMLLVFAAVILISSLTRWLAVLRAPKAEVQVEVEVDGGGLTRPVGWVGTDGGYDWPPMGLGLKEAHRPLSDLCLLGPLHRRPMPDTAARICGSRRTACRCRLLAAEGFRPSTCAASALLSRSKWRRTRIARSIGSRASTGPAAAEGRWAFAAPSREPPPGESTRPPIGKKIASPGVGMVEASG